VPERSALSARLRTETAALHRATEEQAGIPATIGSTSDYITLLTRMLAFHRAAEESLGDPRWVNEWAPLGIQLSDHDRSGQIEDDLLGLGVVAASSSTGSLELQSFAQALGCLYVVEGSALGGQVIAPIIVRTLGPVPTAYYRGDGRAHPGPWRSLQAALGMYSESDGDQDAVIAGAVATFTFFGALTDARGVSHEPV